MHRTEEERKIEKVDVKTLVQTPRAFIYDWMITRAGYDHFGIYITVFNNLNIVIMVTVKF